MVTLFPTKRSFPARGRRTRAYPLGAPVHPAAMWDDVSFDLRRVYSFNRTVKLLYEDPDVKSGTVVLFDASGSVDEPALLAPRTE